MSARFIKHGKLENPGGLAERESLSLLGKVIELSGFSSTVELRRQRRVWMVKKRPIKASDHLS